MINKVLGYTTQEEWDWMNAHWGELPRLKRAWLQLRIYIAIPMILIRDFFELEWLNERYEVIVEVVMAKDPSTRSWAYRTLDAPAWHKFKVLVRFELAYCYSRLVALLGK